MTEKEKAKAYDDVREKIALRFGSNVAEEIFSEFEMSKDEKVRKALIDGFKRYDDLASFNGCLVREILPWLEKQGQWTEADDEEFEIAINTLKGAGQYDSAAWLLTLKQRIRIGE